MARCVEIAATPFREVFLQQSGQVAIGAMPTGAELVKSYLDPGPGPVERTGVATDIALTRSGLFAVRTPQGVRYTRAGDLSVNARGELVTAQGDLVLGNRGAIHVGTGQLAIDPGGQVRVNGRLVDQLRLVSGNGLTLVDTGQGRYAVVAGRPRPYRGQVIQGALNLSTVSEVRTMSSALSAYRAFSLDFQALQAESSTMKLATQAAQV
jgi:Flagellar basal body rod protein